MNNTIKPLPNGDFEVIYPTSEELAAQDEYTRQREKQRDEQNSDNVVKA